MKKLISYYKNEIKKCYDSISEIERMLRESDNDSRICVTDLLGEKENAITNRDIYIKFVADIESTELVQACTKLNEGDEFGHVQDVVTMISKAGNILELHANNTGSTSVIAKAMQNIANNISNSL
tara:strand:+ start:2672 stop:3046 length:375 start_codon:yes stop_codon:yes gene_type:complete